MSQHAVPIFEVAFKNGMWWSIPADTSQRLYEHYKNNEDAVYTWDCGNSRYGSWAPAGEVTSINRYLIDFITWEQRNLNNDRRRSVRLVWVPPQRGLIPYGLGRSQIQEKRGSLAVLNNLHQTQEFALISAESQLN